MHKPVHERLDSEHSHYGGLRNYPEVRGPVIVAPVRFPSRIVLFRFSRFLHPRQAPRFPFELLTSIYSDLGLRPPVGSILGSILHFAPGVRDCRAGHTLVPFDSPCLDLILLRRCFRHIHNCQRRPVFFSAALTTVEDEETKTRKRTRGNDSMNDKTCLFVRVVPFCHTDYTDNCVHFCRTDNRRT